MFLRVAGKPCCTRQRPVETFYAAETTPRKTEEMLLRVAGMTPQTRRNIPREFGECFYVSLMKYRRQVETFRGGAGNVPTGRWCAYETPAEEMLLRVAYAESWTRRNISGAAQKMFLRVADARRSPVETFPFRPTDPSKHFQGNRRMFPRVAREKHGTRRNILRVSVNHGAAAT